MMMIQTVVRSSFDVLSASTLQFENSSNLPQLVDSNVFPQYSKRNDLESNEHENFKNSRNNRFFFGQTS